MRARQAETLQLEQRQRGRATLISDLADWLRVCRLRTLQPSLDRASDRPEGHLWMRDAARVERGDARACCLRYSGYFGLHVGLHLRCLRSLASCPTFNRALDDCCFGRMTKTGQTCCVAAFGRGDQLTNRHLDPGSMSIVPYPPLARRSRGVGIVSEDCYSWHVPLARWWGPRNSADVCVVFSRTGGAAGTSKGAPQDFCRVRGFALAIHDGGFTTATPAAPRRIRVSRKAFAFQYFFSIRFLLTLARLCAGRQTTARRRPNFCIELSKRSSAGDACGFCGPSSCRSLLPPGTDTPVLKSIITRKLDLEILRRAEIRGCAYLK